MATLSEWLRAATPEERQELADSCGTGVNYLYQIAGGHVESPRLKLAQCLVRKIAILRKASGEALPSVSLDELIKE